jgi:pimeloyl-ACP methyl ester carboxylesterase
MARPSDEMPSIIQESVLGHALRYRAVPIVTPDGLSLAAQDWAPDGASRQAELLFLHGFSQSHEAWLHQVSSSLAREFRLVTYDLRGHGRSDQPSEAQYYREPARWADEVDAVIEQTGLTRPILVAWSYSGRVVLDYLSVFGDAGISGLIMVNATANGAPEMMGPAVRLLRQMTEPDAAVALQGTIELLHACVAKPPSAAELDYMLGYNQRVPASIRLHMVGRPADYESVLHALQVPTLIIHGMLDPINSPSMAAYALKHVAGAELIAYDDAAHMPFWEDPQRFNADVARFVRERIVTPRMGEPSHA